MMNRIVALMIMSVLLTCFLPMAGTAEPQVRMRTSPQSPLHLSKKRYPWRLGITATIFWIGESPTANNPTPNDKSSWNQRWQEEYGGFDDPSPTGRRGYFPKKFKPGLNPFYIALPYNDSVKYNQHCPQARRVIPWFRQYRPKPGKSVCHNRWVQIVRNQKICYAQWSDCGPFVTDDWEYVFGNKPPKNKKNKQAGIDISPAIRDFLKIKSGQKVHWRFVELSQVPKGPWSRYGKNNPFVNPEEAKKHSFSRSR